MSPNHNNIYIFIVQWRPYWICPFFKLLKLLYFVQNYIILENLHLKNILTYVIENA